MASELARSGVAVRPEGGVVVLADKRGEGDSACAPVGAAGVQVALRQ